MPSDHDIGRSLVRRRVDLLVSARAVANKGSVERERPIASFL
jgi:hypothetical protein